MHILDSVDAKSLRSDIPDFRAGDNVKVHVNIVEGATWFGFAACWVNRSNSSHEFLDVRPRHEIQSLEKLNTLGVVKL